MNAYCECEDNCCVSVEYRQATYYTLIPELLDELGHTLGNEPSLFLIRVSEGFNGVSGDDVDALTHFETSFRFCNAVPLRNGATKAELMARCKSVHYVLNKNAKQLDASLTETGSPS